MRSKRNYKLKSRTRTEMKAETMLDQKPSI